ncbi:MAG: gamma-glutamyltransferase family protein [Betaproteobacteria bacterium]|nr:gamma-glutamyltransferase family protein [Betaproteobacteria bacterium]
MTIRSINGTRGIAVAPHALAAQSALDVLREGGNALEAMIAAAAAITVAYPHMNSVGGDSFWLFHTPQSGPRGIDACGAAARAASIEWYAARGVTRSIPFRGGLAANTVAGTVAGWKLAHSVSRRWGGRLPLKRLVADAVYYAEHGIAVTASQSAATAAKRGELEAQPGFREAFLPGGTAPPAGSLFRQPRLAQTLARLARAGLEDFYRGRLARAIARDLAAAGSPLAPGDLERHRAKLVRPLVLRHSLGTVYNLPPPTQGLASLLILGMLDALEVGSAGPAGADYVHLAVEATKRAFGVRDHCITDPAYMTVDAQALLAPGKIRELAANVDCGRAARWGAGKAPSDTVWMGVVDGAGRAVSMIQSLYHEFGSGVVLEETGINWQNRGCSFSLDPAALNSLRPGRKPFHTLNPALAVLNDGRTLVYGTMGGDGQPQTQAAVFTRIAAFGMDPQQAVAAPRWLLGRTWGQSSDTLKLESRFSTGVVADLARRGHEMEVLGEFDEAMGHAGAIVRHPNGVLEGGADPRSDGAVAAY